MGRVADPGRKQATPHRSPRASGSTKDAILDAAEILFAADDVTDPTHVTMRAIADAAGVDPASVTYHFGGRTELVTALIRRRYTELRDHRSRLVSGALNTGILAELFDADAGHWEQTLVAAPVPGVPRCRPGDGRAGPHADHRRGTVLRRPAAGRRRGSPGRHGRTGLR